MRYTAKKIATMLLTMVIVSFLTFVAFSLLSGDAATRLLAWNKLCAANAVNSVTVQCETWESSEAYGKMNHILDNIGRTGGNLPTCMVCANDSQAVGVARALHEHGVRVPQDVSLVGFDDGPSRLRAAGCRRHA